MLSPPAGHSLGASAATLLAARLAGGYRFGELGVPSGTDLRPFATYTAHSPPVTDKDGRFIESKHVICPSFMFRPVGLPSLGEVETCEFYQSCFCPTGDLIRHTLIHLFFVLLFPPIHPPPSP